jgi:hypothetical protein
MGIGQLKLKKKEEEPSLSFIPNVQGKIALIDGDVICYHSCPPRRVYDDETTQVVLLGEDGKRRPQEYTPEEEQAYLETAWSNLRYLLDSIHEKVYCDDKLIAMGGGKNFRDDVYPEYKQHRHRNNAFKNTTVPVLRRLAVAEGYAINADGMEADDLLCIWAGEARKIGQDYIICSVDKDLLCIPGQHYRMHKGNEKIITVDELEARRHYHEQLIKGDPTDNIPGVIGIGEKTATKLLKDCTTLDEMQTVVVDSYIKAYDGDWYNNLLMNGQLIHLLTHPGDRFTPDNWNVVKEIL